MVDRIITSLQNPRVKDTLRLRSSRHRRKQQRMLIDGHRELDRALDAGLEILEAFTVSDLTPATEPVVERLRRFGVHPWQVSETVFERLAFGERGAGVIATARTPQHELAELQPRGEGPIAVVEGVEKPGNVGAILRSADAAGVAAVIVADPATDLYNPNCIRASLGAVFTVPLAVATAVEVRTWLHARQSRVYAARVDAALDFTSARLTGNVALVLGSEAAGLSELWQQADVAGIRLPMLGQVDSLNVSATAAVLFYEALRQRLSAASI